MQKPLEGHGGDYDHDGLLISFLQCGGDYDHDGLLISFLQCGGD